MDYQAGGIVSRQIVKKTTGNVTLFAFDRGQELTEHTSSFDALVHVLEGIAEIVVAGRVHEVREAFRRLRRLRVPCANRPASRRTQQAISTSLIQATIACSNSTRR